MYPVMIHTRVETARVPRSNELFEIIWVMSFKGNKIFMHIGADSRKLSQIDPPSDSWRDKSKELSDKSVTLKFLRYTFAPSPTHTILNWKPAWSLANWKGHKMCQEIYIKQGRIQNDETPDIQSADTIYFISIFTFYYSYSQVGV